MPVTTSAALDAMSSTIKVTLNKQGASSCALLHPFKRASLQTCTLALLTPPPLHPSTLQTCIPANVRPCTAAPPINHHAPYTVYAPQDDTIARSNQGAPLRALPHHIHRPPPNVHPPKPKPKPTPTPAVYAHPDDGQVARSKQACSKQAWDVFYGMVTKGRGVSSVAS